MKEFQRVLDVVVLNARKEGIGNQRRKITFHTFGRFCKTVISDQVNTDYSEWILLLKFVLEKCTKKRMSNNASTFVFLLIVGSVIVEYIQLLCNVSFISIINSHILCYDLLN